MLNFGKVAVTGGLSCGKSSVCRVFKELGAYVVSADDIVHQLLSSNTKPGQQVIELLGPDIVTQQGLDRAKIAELVFNNQKLLQALEKILHPAVKEEIDNQYQKVKDREDIPLFIVEIPLLFETGAQDLFDRVITVIAAPEVCIKRFHEQTGYSKVEFDRRMNRQQDPLEKAKRADYVIVNNGSLEELRQNVKELFQSLKTVRPKI